MGRLMTSNGVAGVFFCALAIAGLWLSRTYGMGSADNMGPGYMPRLLCFILLGVGLISILRGLFRDGERIALIGLRPAWWLTLAVILFGLLIQPAGLFFASFVSVLTAGLAGRGVRPAGLLLTATLLSILAVAIFVWSLGMPVSAWPRV